MSINPNKVSNWIGIDIAKGCIGMGIIGVLGIVHWITVPDMTLIIDMFNIGKEKNVGVFVFCQFMFLVDFSVIDIISRIEYIVVNIIDSSSINDKRILLLIIDLHSMIRCFE